MRHNKKLSSSPNLKDTEHYVEYTPADFEFYNLFFFFWDMQYTCLSFMGIHVSFVRAYVYVQVLLECPIKCVFTLWPIAKTEFMSSHHNLWQNCRTWTDKCACKNILYAYWLCLTNFNSCSFCVTISSCFVRLLDKMTAVLVLQAVRARKTQGRGHLNTSAVHMCYERMKKKKDFWDLTLENCDKGQCLN